MSVILQGLFWLAVAVLASVIVLCSAELTWGDWKARHDDNA